MKYSIVNLLVFGAIALLTGCHSVEPYTIKMNGKQIPIEFIGEVGDNDGPMRKIVPLPFPKAEAIKAINKLHSYTKFRKNESIYEIYVLDDYIRVDTIIETNEERKKRLEQFETYPAGVEGRVFIMKTRDNKWFVTSEMEKM